QRMARQAELGGDGGGLSHVIRLRRALRDDGIDALFESVAQQEFQFAGLVAAAGEPGAVVPLDPQGGTTEQFAQRRHRFERRGQMRETNPGKARQQHSVSSWRYKGRQSYSPVLARQRT